MRVETDTQKCCGAGQCVLAAPDVFDQDDDQGLVVLIDPSPPSRSYEAVRLAAELCPSGAITVRECADSQGDLQHRCS